MGKKAAVPKAPALRIHGKSKSSPPKAAAKAEVKRKEQPRKSDLGKRNSGVKDVKKRGKEDKEDVKTNHDKKAHNERNLKQLEKTLPKKKKTGSGPSDSSQGNRGLERLGSKSSQTSSPAPLEDLSEIEADMKQASARGMSLKDYMSEQSAKELDAHMRKLQQENNDKQEETDDDDEEEKHEDDNDDSELDEEESEDEETERDACVEPEQTQVVCKGDESSSQESESDSSDSEESEEEEQKKTSKKKEDKKKKEKELQLAKEFWYYVGQGGEINKSVAVTEETAVELKDKGPNKDMIMAMTSGDGPLAPGACPKVGGLEKAAAKGLNAGLAKKKKKKSKKSTPEGKDEEN
eukprot:symbB.v1.2.035117.t1/scaffold4656.1/size89520/6